MSTLGAGPNLVTDGMTLFFDPANIKSYPGSGGTIYDLSPGGNNGTITNAVFDADNGGSLYFDGSGDYVTIEDYSVSDDQPFTFCGWIKPVTGIESLTYAVVFALKADTTHWQVSYTSDSNYNILFAFAGTSTSVKTTSSSQDLIALNSWGHLAVSYNGGAKATVSNWKIYVNGQEVSITGAGSTGAATNETALGYRIGGGTNNYFKGNITNCFFYNRALTEAEIVQNYNVLRGRFGL